jgi:hypothetical protein
MRQLGGAGVENGLVQHEPRNGPAGRSVVSAVALRKETDQESVVRAEEVGPGQRGDGTRQYRGQPHDDGVTCDRVPQPTGTADIGGRPHYAVSTANTLDVRAFADQITWGRVTRVSGQTIEIDASAQ